MAHLVTDEEIDRRLRSARPGLDDIEPDLELLARVTAQPVAARPRRIAAPLAVATAALAVAAVFLLARGPEPASAIQQALRWFNPPAGTILHSKSVDNATGATREIWQDTDNIDHTRMIVTVGGSSFEEAPDAIYDPATNTIYEEAGATKPAPGADDAVKKRALVGVAPARRQGAKSKPEEAISGDPIVAKIRMLLAEDRATVAGREVHNGVEAWAIKLKPDAGRPTWTLWVRADNGTPLAIDDPGDPSRDKPGESRTWTDYEVLESTEVPLTLAAAHPDARVVRDANQFKAVYARLMNTTR